MNPILMTAIVNLVTISIRTFAEVSGRQPEGEEIEALIKGIVANSQAMVAASDERARRAIEEARR